MASARIQDGGISTLSWSYNGAALSGQAEQDSGVDTALGVRDVAWFSPFLAYKRQDPQFKLQQIKTKYK